MSTSFVARLLGAAPSGCLRPRVPSLFEPGAEVAPPVQAPSRSLRHRVVERPTAGEAIRPVGTAAIPREPMPTRRQPSDRAHPPSPLGPQPAPDDGTGGMDLAGAMDGSIPATGARPPARPTPSPPRATTPHPPSPPPPCGEVADTVHGTGPPLVREAERVGAAVLVADRVATVVSRPIIARPFERPSPHGPVAVRPAVDRPPVVIRQPASTVHVSIGTIEVRASVAATPKRTAGGPSRHRAPALDEYLRNRSTAAPR